MIYAVNYDLKKPGHDYEGLYGAIKGCGAWWHYLESTWLIQSGLNAHEIWTRLASHCDQNDRVLVIRVTSDYSGWLPKEAWEWIDSHMRVAA